MSEVRTAAVEVVEEHSLWSNKSTSFKAHHHWHRSMLSKIG